MENNQLIDLICDYLRNPDAGHKVKVGKARDEERYNKLEDSLNKKTNENPGPLGELIVRL